MARVQSLRNGQQDLGMPMKIIPGKVFELPTPTTLIPTLEAPRGLKNVEAIAEEYIAGEKILALRSNGSWSHGIIADVGQEKLTIILENGNGIKQIRKDMAGSLLKKRESTKEAALEVEKTRVPAKKKSENSKQSEVVCLTYDEAIAKGLYSQHDHCAADPCYILQAASEPGADAKHNWIGQKMRNTTSDSMDSSGSTNSDRSRSSAASISSCSLPSVSDVDECSADGLEEVVSDERTSVMMRNIPNNMTRKELLSLLDDAGFHGCYDLVYLPVDLKNEVGLGYGFINLVSHADAAAFMQYFDGFKNWTVSSENRSKMSMSEKLCKMSWSDALQGLDEHIQRYRNCPVMHESVNDEFKPILFKDGVRVPFPEPTKKIRAPRPWSRRHQ